jgi:flagellar motility protein MotE (MotC chaperone)
MWKILSRIRVLPVALSVAILIVSLKIGDVAELLGGANPLHVGKVQAQQPPQPKGAQQPQAKGGPTQLQAPPGAQQQAPAPQRAQNDTPPVPAVRESSADPANDPTLFTQNEIDLLQQLAERREAIDKQMQEMTSRQGLMLAAEQRIDRKIVELKSLQAAIDALIKKHDEQEEQKLQSLVKIYEGMKPKDAGRIFEELDIDTLLLVAERMKERKLSPIMATLNPVKAKEVTEKISTGRKLPLPGAGG